MDRADLPYRRGPSSRRYIPIMDVKAVNAYAYQVWSHRQGAVVARMIHLGHRLGLYKAMAGQGPMSADALAERAGISRRYAEEWLRCQAAGGLLEYDNDLFMLPDAGAAVLADDEHSPFFSATAFVPTDARAEADRLAAAFTSDSGYGYDEGGHELVEVLEGLNAPWARLLLPTVVVDAIPGLRRQLETGATIIDVGCGSGLAIAALADAFPASTFYGIDPSELAIARSRQVLAPFENASAEVGYAESIEDRHADIVTAFDCLHDMSRPDLALQSIRRVLGDDGLLVVKDIRTAATFEEQLKNPMLAMMYGLSIMSCLPSGLASDDGLGLGNQGLHPEKLADLAAEAGFTRFDVHDLNDPVNLYYEIRT